MDVARQLVDDAQRSAVHRSQVLEVPISLPFYRVASPCQGSGFHIRSAQDSDDVANLAQFARAVDLGMTGRDLMHKRRAGTRHSNDEHRHIRRFAPIPPLLEEFGHERINHLLDLSMNHLRVIPLPDGRLLLFHKGIGLGVARERVVETADFVQQFSKCKARGKTADGGNIRRIERSREPVNVGLLGGNLARVEQMSIDKTDGRVRTKLQHAPKTFRGFVELSLRL